MEQTKQEVQKQSFLDVALDYYEEGFRVIPLNLDNSPAVLTWKQYQDSQTESEVRSIFSNPCYGIGIIMCDGLEAIDLDLKYDISGQLTRNLMGALDAYDISLLNDFGRQVTRSRGFHFIYKCSEVASNTKLASRPATAEEMEAENETRKANNAQLEKDQKNGKRQNEKPAKLVTDPDSLPKVLIETRGGDGGYIAVYPTPGYSMDRGVWEMDEIPEIDPDTRTTIWNVSKSFNEIVAFSQKSSVDRQAVKMVSHQGLTTADDYNAKCDMMALLQTYGWQLKKEDSVRAYFTRPGKDTRKGHSADLNKDLGLFTVWSTSTNFDAGKAYSAFGVYTQLAHGGDYSSSARALYNQGYGDRIKKQQGAKSMVIPSAGPGQKSDFDIEAIVAKVNKTRFDVKAAVPNPPACGYLKVDGKERKLAGFGQIGFFTGKSKHGKTFVMTNMVAACLRPNERFIGFRMNPKGRSIAYFDADQSDVFYKLSQKRLMSGMAKLKDNVAHYDAYSLATISDKERVAYLDHIIMNSQNLGIVFIDGFVDLLTNFNDIDESMNVINHLIKWRDEKNLLIIGSLHNNKGDGKPRGHLGSFFLNKSDFQVNVTKLEDVDYQVGIPLCRYGPQPPFTFWRDKTDGLGYREEDEVDVDKMNDDEDVPF